MTWGTASHKPEIFFNGSHNRAAARRVWAGPFYSVVLGIVNVQALSCPAEMEFPLIWPVTRRLGDSFPDPISDPT